jgi:hypothetical protein
MRALAGNAPPRPSRLLERLRRRVLSPLFDRLGYDLVPAIPDWTHRPVSTREVDTLLRAAADSLALDFGRAGLPSLAGYEALVREFWELIPSCPVRQRRGGNGFNGCLQLFAIMRALDPPIIVESGVFRGLTTWIFRQACPEAAIYCFDPVLSGLQYRDESARYSEEDWSAADFAGVDLRDAVAFFDDHVSQARRVIEADERGITRLIFDDDATSHRVHAHGGPAFPTVDMILAEPAAEPVRWVRNGREFVFPPDEGLARQARERIATAHAFDDLHRATGYSPTRLAYVTLHRRERAAP